MARALPGMKGVTIPDKGFFYHDPTHRYFMDGKRMTGVTTIVDGVGDKSNLIQWASNQAALEALLNPLTPKGRKAFSDKVATYKKIDSRAARELDKLCPKFASARTASNKVKDKAADAGKEAHRMCELYQLGELMKMAKESFSEEGWRRFNEWRKFYDANVEYTYFVERPLFSTTLFLGGTPDGGWKMKDQRNLIQDNKFKGALWDPSPFRQMAAYRMMLEEMATDTSTPVRIDWGEGRTEEYASPREYLGSFGGVEWHGAVVIRVGEDDFEEMYADTYEADKRGFLAALEIYRENGAFKNRVMNVTD